MFIPPMLLEKADRPFQDPAYIAEIKYDGFRFLYSTVNGRYGYTRHQTSCLNRFPELLNIPLPPNSVIDGELIVTDENGHPDFEAVMNRFQTTHERKIQMVSKDLPAHLVVFDILRYQGKDMTQFPLLKRKELLKRVIPEHSHISVVPYVEGQAGKLFELVKRRNLEGIVLKKKDSLYEVGKRSSNWLKVINWYHHQVWLTGVRKGEMAYLISYPNGRPAGVVELPLPLDARKALQRMIPYIKCGEDERFVYLRPKIHCEVKSRGFTKAGYLRDPVWQRFWF